MQYDSAYRQYRDVDLGARTAQASPVQLVLILMDGLLDELARARAHIEAQRFEAKAHSLDKCIGILNGLSSALDLDTGGEVVENLARLYDYCAQRLYHAGVSLDPVHVDEVARLLGTIKAGWEGIQDQHG